MNIPELLDNTKEIRLTPIVERDGAIRSYRRILMRVIREIRAEINRSVIPAYSRGIIPDSAVSDIGERRVLQFAVVRSVAALSIQTANDAFRLMMDAENRTHLLLVARSVRKSTGIDVAPWLRLNGDEVDDLVRLYINRNAALITSLSDELVGRVEQAVFQAKIDRTNRHDLTEILQRSYGLSENRARLIATDQLASINSDFTQSRHTALGITQYIWRTRQDGNVRELHRSIAGNTYTWGEPSGAEGGLAPGKNINCFAGHSKVDSLSNVSSLFRRPYSGKLVTLITESGKSIQSTPNHPHLSSRGWVAAQDFNIGDNLVNVGPQSVFTLNAHAKNRETSIKEIFDLCSLVFSSESTEGLASNFHGDGRVDHDVDIVDIKGGLKLAWDFLGSKRVEQNLFSVTDINADGLLPSNGSFSSTFFTDRLAAKGIVGFFGEIFSILFTESGHSNDVRLRAASDFYALALKACDDTSPRHAVLATKGEDAISRHIIANHEFYINFFRVWWGAVVSNQLVASPNEPLAEAVSVNPDKFGDFAKSHSIDVVSDAVVDISSVDFFGHVYNLETELGLYTVDEIITKNCRCTGGAVIPANAESVARQERLRAEIAASNTEARARARREARRSGP